MLCGIDPAPSKYRASVVDIDTDTDTDNMGGLYGLQVG